jgi:hypothetical protein
VWRTAACLRLRPDSVEQNRAWFRQKGHRPRRSIRTMADAAEIAFINTFVRTLGAQPVVYPDDYCQPPENSLKRVPILPVRVDHAFQ